MPKFKLPVSSLPRHVGCRRSWAAKHVKELKDRCVAERAEDKEVQHVAPVFGESCHVGAFVLLTAKMRHGKIGKTAFDAALEDAATFFTAKWAEKKVQIDKLTSGVKEGLKQMEKTLSEFAHSYARLVQPKYLEHEMESDMNPYIRLTGRVDHLTEDGWNDNYKFGSRKAKAYQSQFGGEFTLIQRTLPDYPIQGGRIVDTLRHGVDDEQSETRIKEQNYDACVDSAFYQIEAITYELQQWDDTKNRKLWIFDANNTYTHCNEKGCPAWGTSVCDQWERTETKEKKREWVTF